MNFYDYRFMDIAGPIIRHPEYQQIKNIKHHDESVYDHSIKVAYHSYVMAYKLGLDYKSVIRGALLHDFYLYKFKKTLKLRLIKDSIMHAINHPKIAYKNASQFFVLNKNEENIIKGHMFPFGLPRSREAWIVSFADKYIATYEYMNNFRKLAFKRAYN